MHPIACAGEDPNEIPVAGRYLPRPGWTSTRYSPPRQPCGKALSLSRPDPFGVRLGRYAGGRVTEVGGEFAPVVWGEAAPGKTLSWCDRNLQTAFLEPSLGVD